MASEDSKQSARPVSSMTEAEKHEELAQLTALVGTLNGADNKKKRGRVNGRITTLRESLGASTLAQAAPSVAKTEQPKNPHKEKEAARKDSKSAAAAPAAKANGGSKARERSDSKNVSEIVDVLKAPPAGKVVLGYWKIRGLAETIRYLLEYTKTPYVERLYEVGPAPTYDRSVWLADKANPKLALDFPNLPFYLEGDLRITQSGAIIRHLARKNNLYGDNETEHTRVDMMEGEIIDWARQIMGICYQDGFEENLKNVVATVLPDFAAKFEGFLGKNKFLIGNKLTYVDFSLYTLLDQANIMTSFLSKHSKLAAFHDNIRNLPAIKEYLASSRFFARPINNLMAKFK